MMTDEKRVNLKVFRSSAGSGKTYTLAKEYIKLLLVHPVRNKSEGTENYFRHILALTFTNDAANEMKQRVMDYLKGFVSLKDEKYIKILEQIIEEIHKEYPGISIDKNIVSGRSAIILRSILHRYSEFNIQTIDSFTNQIARSFSRELGLPGDYEIFLDTELKIAEAVDLMLSEINKNEKILLKWLFRFVEDQINEDRTWNIGYGLKNISGSIVQEDKYELLEKLKSWELEDFDKLRKDYQAEFKILDQGMKKPADEALKYLDNQGVEEKDLKGKSRGIQTYFVKVYSSSFGEDLNNTHQKLYNEGVFLSPDSPLSNQQQINQEILKYLDQIQNFRQKYEQRYFTVKNVLKNLYELALLNRIKSIVQDMKERDEQAFISDLNEKIREVVLSEPVPFIYEKSGVRYKHLLIDEFQDTSVFQWINLIPLISNSMAEGNVNLIVGDAKQSIYRWRGADPELLVYMPELKGKLSDSKIREHLNDWPLTTGIFHLNSNWRSRSGIINFNNSFFNWLRESEESFEEFRLFYEDVKQEVQVSGESDVRIDVIEDPEGDKDEQLANRETLLVEYIRSCEAENYEMRQIAVLCRKNSETRWVSEILLSNNISVISDESLLLSSSRSVDLLIRVFEYILEPGNDDKCLNLFLAMSQVLNYPIENWEEIRSELFSSDAIKDIRKMFEFFNISFDYSTLVEGSVYQLGQAWIRALSLNKNFQEQVYTDYFLDVLYDHSSKADSGLSQFMEFWNEKKESLSISSSPDQNAVRVISIHKAKGLEYPVIIIPFPEWSYTISASTTKIWTEREGEDNTKELPVAVLNPSAELEKTEFAAAYDKEKKAKFIEEINALYVAMTRAEHKLYIMTVKGKRDGKQMGKLIRTYLEGTEHEAAELKKNEMTLFRYQLYEKRTPEKEGIEKRIDPWNNNRFERSKISRGLRWKTDFSLSEEQLQRIRSGKAFHLLMSGFEYKTDFDSVMKMAEAVFEEEGYNSFKVFLIDLISNDITGDFFNESWKVYTEKEILYKGNLIRPDRFQVRDDELVILDYKTGQESEKYLEQLKLYENALGSLYPEKKIRSFLIFHSPLKLISGS